MKIEINSPDGSTHTLDTSKITDKEAEVFEALDNLYNICRRYNLMAHATVALDTQRNAGITSISSNPVTAQEEFDCLLGGLNNWLRENTKGRLHIAQSE